MAWEADDRTAALEALVRDLVSECCPMNWGDDLDSAAVWLRAETMCGTDLPDVEHRDNLRARAMLKGEG